MNHIARLTQERDEALATIRRVREELTEICVYLQSPKFTGPDCDYVHVRTDILPKVSNARFLALT